MTTFFAYLWRLCVIVTGFLASALGASLMLNIAFLVMAGETEPLAEGWAASGLIISVPLVAVFVGYFSLLPALALIAASEVFSLRSALFFCLSGCATGAAIGLLLPERDPADLVNGVGAGFNSGPWGAVMLGLAASGIVGGFVYWLVAGRNAGRLFDRIAEARSASGISGSGSTEP